MAKVDKRALDLDKMYLFVPQILTAHLQCASYCARYQNIVQNETSPCPQKVHTVGGESREADT